VKDGSGAIHAQGTIPATAFYLDRMDENAAAAWTAAMEATVFTGGLHHLQPHAAALKVAHPLMLRAIAAGEKDNDSVMRADCDCLRCDFPAGVLHASTAIRRTAGARCGTQPAGSGRWCR